MFLHSGASLHGHEYSRSLRPGATNTQPGNRRSPLLRSSLGKPISRATPSPTPSSDGPLRQQTRLPADNSPAVVPEPAVRFQEPEVALPKPEVMSEDETSYSGTDASYLSDTTTSPKPRRRRRLPRQGSTFLFAHPPPNLRAKKQLPIHIRPKLLMQVQKLSSETRPRPSMDVFPASLLTGNVVTPRISKRFPRIFGVKGELGLHDVILVKSEDYDSGATDSDSDGEESNLEKRELIAVLSPLRREDRAEIVLEDGCIWVATRLPSGHFDFAHTDEHGNTTTARWARRAASKSPFPPSSEPTSPTSLSPASSPSPLGDYKYTFSVIDPDSRRHPIMGTLTTSTLEILDNYTTVSQSSGRYPPSKPLSRSLTTPSSPVREYPPGVRFARQDEGQEVLPPTTASPFKERTTYPVDDALKNLMSVTAVWVALRQGWAPNYKPSTLPPEAPANITSASHLVNGNSASGIPTSLHSRLSARRKGSPRSDDSQPPDAAAPPRGPNSSSTMPDPAGNRPPALRKGHTVPLATPAARARARDPSPAASLQQPRLPVLPRRATSTGAAFMQRRMQVQLSDASDSEKGAAAAARRSTGRRVLSGDFGARARQPPAPGPALAELSANVAAGEEMSSAAGGEDGNDVVQAEVLAPSPHRSSSFAMGGGTSTGRRAVSAYYTSNPMRLDAAVGQGQGENNNYELERGDGGYLTEDDYAVGGVRADRAARWKRLGNWFRRLGGR